MERHTGTDVRSFWGGLLSQVVRGSACTSDPRDEGKALRVGRDRCGAQRCRCRGSDPRARCLTLAGAEAH